MNFLNLHVSTLESSEVLGSDDFSVVRWLKLLRYCVVQENGGTIKGCRGWKTQMWQHICGATKEQIDASALLLKWRGQDLVVFGYPVEQERVQQAKRKGGAEGGKRRAENMLKQAELDVLLNADEKAQPGDGRPVKVKSYTDIADTRNDVVDVASAITGDRTPMGRGYWKKAIEIIGQEQFRAQLMTLWGEIEAGEKPKNPAAVLTGRLKTLVERKGAK